MKGENCSGSVSQHNDKWRYIMRYKDDTDNWKKKEVKGFVSRREASAALRKAMNDFESTGFVKKAKSRTFEQYYHELIELHKTEWKYATLKTYNYIYKNHFQELAEMPIDKIKYTTIQKLINEKKLTHSYGTLEVIWAILKGIFNLAIKNDAISYSPLSRVDRKFPPKNKKQFNLNIDLIQKISVSLSETIFHAPFTLALHTGCRRGEALGLMWEKVDFENNLITFDSQLQYQGAGLVIVPPKTYSSNRTILMAPLLREYLLGLREQQDRDKDYYRDYYHDSGFVCANENGLPIDPKRLTLKFRQLSAKLESPFSFHDLRHAHATFLLESGANPKAIQARLGHSDISITLNTYSHVTKVMEEVTMGAFENMLKESDQK